jgi:hypothetical protein
MEPTNLNPEAIRKIGIYLYGAERFQADPANVILSTLEWVRAVMGNSEAQLFGNPIRDDLVRQLSELVSRKGVANVAMELEVSVAAVRSWEHGVTPSPLNLEKIKKYLKSQSSASDAAGTVDTPKSGELFQQQLEPKTSTADKQPEPTKD